MTLIMQSFRICQPNKENDFAKQRFSNGLSGENKNKIHYTYIFLFVKLQNRH